MDFKEKYFFRRFTILKSIKKGAIIAALFVMQCGVLTAQQDTAIVLNEVTIYATQSALVSVGGERLPVRQIPMSISVIRPQQIQKLNINTIDEALLHVTGVTVIANDNMRSHYKTRGYNMSVMYNGLPSYGSLSISQQLDLSFYEQIEVLRGAAGLLQGTPGEQNISGVINLLNKRPTKELGINAAVSIGSWNNYRSEIDVNVPLNASKTLRSRWMVFGADRNFFYERAHQTKKGAYGIIEWNATPSTLISASYSYQNTKSDAVFVGIPAIRETSDDQSRNILQTSRSTNPTPDWDWTKWNTQDVFFSVNQKINQDWQVTLKANYREQTQENKYAWAGTITRTNMSSNYQRGYHHQDIPRFASALDVTGKFRLFNREHSVLAGLNLENFLDDKKQLSGYHMAEWGKLETVPDFGEIPYDNLNPQKMRITQNGLYGQLRLTVFEPLKMILGGRIGSVDAKQYNFTNSEWVDILEEKNKFTPFAGIVYTPLEQLVFYASYSELFVPQTEKRADGSMLDPRTGSNFEAGTKNKFFNNRLGFNLAFFYLQDEGRAYRVNPGEPVFINGGKVENHGIDLEINANPLQNLELNVGYTWLKTKITKSSSGDEGLAWSPVEPEHSVKFLGIYNIENGVLQGLSAGVGIMANSAKYASVLTPERKQDSYSVTNLFLNYTINSHFSFNLNFNNIFDKTYYARVGGNGDFFGEPFNISATVRCRF